MYRERRRVISAHEKGNDEVQPNVEVLIKVLVDFRQTAIKLGVLMDAMPKVVVRPVRHGIELLYRILSMG